MYTLGISAYFHDSAACLLKDDHIIGAVQEERFTRKKNDESFPLYSILYCLKQGQITLKEVDHVVFYEKPFLKFERLLETYLAFSPTGFISFMKAMPVWLKSKLFLKKNIIKQLKSIDSNWDPKVNKLLFTTHHQSHAASAFYPSPFTKAVILTADGVGEWTTTSVAIGTNNRIEQVKEINFPHSIGLLYSAFTYYLGFKVNCDEYKVMGLAPYGKPLYIDHIFNSLIDLKADGSFCLNMQYFNYCTGLTMTSSRFHQLFGQPPRRAGQEANQFHMDVASSIQAATEKIMLTLTSALHHEYQIDDLCMAGGVALNCVVNGKILKQSGFKRIWIQPAAGDAGGALGAAYTAYYEFADDARTYTKGNDKMQNALLGPSFSNNEIRKCLIEKDIAFEELSTAILNEKVAAFLADGKVVGYFRGRMEFGPRALGARSILADPRNAAMQSILNQKIKFRESFRPFGPAVMEEHTSKYFELSEPSPYMLLVTSVNARHRIPHSENEMLLKDLDASKTTRSVIPAITHIDCTARLQTVNQQGHPDFYNLLNAFYQLTDCPCLVNTSFNRMDEPLVNTPLDALACFKATGIDILVLENFLVTK